MAPRFLPTTLFLATSSSASSPSPPPQLAFACRDAKCSILFQNTLSTKATGRISYSRAYSVPPRKMKRMAPSLSFSKLTKLHHSSPYDASSSTEINPLSDVPLSQLLDMLQECNIRYDPDATRTELERLLRTHFNEELSVSRTKANGNTTRKDMEPTEGREVIDAVVLSEEAKHQKQRHPSDEGGDGTHSPTANRRRDRSEGRNHADASRNRRYTSTDGTEYDDERKRPRARRRNVYHRRDRPAREPRSDPRPYHNRRPRYFDREESHTPAIDVDASFDLPEDRARERGTYENGLQIFWMGFVEAGKTVSELALDAARGIADPWTSRGREEGAWWFDEERGREVYDAKVVDYTRERERERYDRDGRRRRRPLDRGGSRRDRGCGSPRHWEEEESELDYREDTSRRSQADRLERVLAPTGRSPSRSRYSMKEEGISKPVYGLYSGGDTQISDEEEEAQNRHSHHPKQQWKDRLRRKFDAALGLESSSSITSQEAYYDSWIKHMEGIDDSRKTRLRDKLNDETAESTDAPPPSASNSSKVPRNRRARMRAAKNNSADEQRPPSSAGRTKSPRLRLDEKPFWKERGSIAAMLFDNRPASWKKNVPKKRRNTLEQLLLSPLGRERTLTSLLVYIARSSLAVFGTLCRWAGVRGTIPQPIVVITVSAVILSSYRGQQKLLSMGLTLLALRMIGEFIHGSVHGNEFWDDEYDNVTHEWVKDDDGGDSGRSNMRRIKL